MYTVLLSNRSIHPSTHQAHPSYLRLSRCFYISFYVFLFISFSNCPLRYNLHILVLSLLSYLSLLFHYLLRQEYSLQNKFKNKITNRKQYILNILNACFIFPSHHNRDTFCVIIISTFT